MKEIETDNKNLGRRKFLQRLMIGILSIEAGYLLFDFLKNRKLEDTLSTWMELGDIDDFEVGMHPVSKGKFYLNKLEDGGLMAISYKCSHLGCAINIDSESKGFECPCHASHFNQYGEVKSPPATRPLDIFPIEIRNNKIKVDTENPIRRNKFEKTQITYA